MSLCWNVYWTVSAGFNPAVYGVTVMLVLHLVHSLPVQRVQSKRLTAIRSQRGFAHSGPPPFRTMTQLCVWPFSLWSHTTHGSSANRSVEMKQVLTQLYVHFCGGMAADETYYFLPSMHWEHNVLMCSPGWWSNVKENRACITLWVTLIDSRPHVIQISSLFHFSLCRMITFQFLQIIGPVCLSGRLLMFEVWKRL